MTFTSEREKMSKYIDDNVLLAVAEAMTFARTHKLEDASHITGRYRNRIKKYVMRKVMNMKNL